MLIIASYFSLNVLWFQTAWLCKEQELSGSLSNKANKKGALKLNMGIINWNVRCSVSGDFVSLQVWWASTQISQCKCEAARYGGIC